jgi:hypothetical protein
VKINKNTLAWEDWQRFSLRKEQAMLMGGLKGSITYSGNLSEYLPLIEFCEKVHLGNRPLSDLAVSARRRSSEEYPPGCHRPFSPSDHRTPLLPFSPSARNCLWK